MTEPVLHGGRVVAGGYRNNQPIKKKPRLLIDELPNAKVALASKESFDKLSKVRSNLWDRFLAFFNVFRWVVLKIYKKANDGTDVPTFYKVNYTSFKNTFPHLSKDEINKQLEKSRDVTVLLNRFVLPAGQVTATHQTSGTVPIRTSIVSEQKFQGTDYELGVEILTKISEGKEKEAAQLVEQAKLRHFPVEKVWSQYKSNPDGFRVLAKGLLAISQNNGELAKQHLEEAANKGMSYAKALLGAKLKNKTMLEESQDCSSSHLELGKLAFKEDNDLVKAEEYYKKALQEHPSDSGMHDLVKAEAYMCLAILKQSNPKECFEMLTKSIEVMEKDVKKGHPQSQFLLGRSLTLGYNQGGYVIKQDLERAQELLEKSAKHGHIKARQDLYELGVRYANADQANIPKDAKKYLEIMDTTAELGHPDALYYHGINYVSGTTIVGTIAPELERGERYLIKAAEFGNFNAKTRLHSLANDYLKGYKHVPQNFKKYLAIKDKLIQLNDLQTLFLHGQDLLKGKDFGDGDLIAVDRELGKGYIQKAADLGLGDAQKFIFEEKAKGNW